MFVKKLRYGIDASGGNVCVGLDPHPALIPERFGSKVAGVQAFLEWIIDETVDHACAYKPNSAFYERMGPAGWQLLDHIIERVHSADRPVILDAKRGDIASTAAAYAQAAFDVLKADAITLVAYMGEDAVVPFLERGGFAFVVALPSNASSRAIVNHGSPPLYEQIASLVANLSLRFPDQLGLVVGATQADAVQAMNAASANLPWLVPGLGAQGGQAKTFFAATQHDRIMVVNASRSILFALDPGQAAERMKREIEEARHD